MRLDVFRNVCTVGALTLVVILSAVAHGDDGSSSSGNEPIPWITLIVNSTPSASISDAFLETTMDIAVILDRDHCDFTDPKLLTMVKALNLTVLRIGGTEGDFLYYDLESSADPAPPPPPPYTRSVSGAMLLRAFDFVRSLGIKFVFGLNTGAGPRRTGSNGVPPAWEPTEAQRLMTWLAAKNLTDSVAGFEFGNEPNLFPYNSPKNDTISGTQFAADVVTFKRLVQQNSPSDGTWITTCCDVAYMPIIGESWDFMTQFAAANGTAHVDFITWHFYPLLGGKFPAKDDPLKATPERIFDALVLDQVGFWADHLKTVVEANAPRTAKAPAYILGETGSAVGGGQEGVSDRFCDIVEYLDKAGQMAVRGQTRVWRQTLCGSPDQYYGLISHNIHARPSYFAALLFRRLIKGSVVHSVTVDPWETLGGVRVYAFDVKATSKKVLLIVSLGNSSLVNVTVQVPTSWSGATQVGVYELTAPQIDAPVVWLNKEPLNVNAKGLPPSMRPRWIPVAWTTNPSTFTLPMVAPKSVTFVEF